MIFDNIPQHLRGAAMYAAMAGTRRPVYVSRRMYDLVKEYLEWKKSHPTRQSDYQTVPVTSHLGTPLPPPRP